jgi:hypothetical protein
MMMPLHQHLTKRLPGKMRNEMDIKKWSFVCRVVHD